MKFRIEIALRNKIKYRASHLNNNKYEISWMEYNRLAVKCKSPLDDLLKKIEETRNRLRRTPENNDLLRLTDSDLLLTMSVEKRVLDEPFEFRIFDEEVVIEREIPGNLRKEERKMYIHYLEVHTRKILLDLFEEKIPKMEFKCKDKT